MNLINPESFLIEGENVHDRESCNFQEMNDCFKLNN